MLRDSCLYSSLACSVYSIRWVIIIFLSFWITCRYLFIIWHKRQLALRDLFCWKIRLYILWVHEEGRDWFSECGRILPTWGRRSKQSCVLSFGRPAAERRSSTVSPWWFVEVVALFHDADVAVTSSGFRFMAESTVPTVVFPDGVRSCMETPIFIVYLWFMFWLTNHIL